MKKSTVQKERVNFVDKRIYFVAMLICTVFFLFNSTACASKEVNQFKKEADEYLISSKFQGTVLIGKGKKILFAQGYGLEDKKQKASAQNSLSTVFEAGSITKQMTAAAIMQLEQKHKLSTKDKLSKYFPDYKYGNEITLEMLLNMRSGLTDYINSPDEFFPKNIYRHIENHQLGNKPLEKDIVLTYFYDAPLLTKPDSTYFYCNTNYYLLAKIIEIVTGKTYEAYIKKNIFFPCGMKNSNLNFQQTDTKGYDYRGRYYSIPASLSLGCGDLNSSVIDLFKWNVNLTNGKIVKKSSFKKMIDSESYGFGLYCRDDTIFHSGTTNVFNSYNFYDTKEKLSVIVLVNRPINQTNATFVAGNILKFYQN